jgi:hypothetical protein
MKISRIFDKHAKSLQIVLEDLIIYYCLNKTNK